MLQRMLSCGQLYLIHTCVSAKTKLLPGIPPILSGIHVDITTGCNVSWSWSMQGPWSPEVTGLLGKTGILPHAEKPGKFSLYKYNVYYQVLKIYKNKMKIFLSHKKSFNTHIAGPFLLIFNFISSFCMAFLYILTTKYWNSSYPLTSQALTTWYHIGRLQ